VHCEILGWPGDDVTLRLDHREFAYAGKFVMSATGKAVLHERDQPVLSRTENPATAFPGRDSDEYAESVLAAVAFNADRTDASVCWLRYVTVARDRRGEGLGPRLLAFVRDRALDRGYDRIRIAVNNPYAYDALHKVGFAYTGRTTGLAELVLEHPDPDSDGDGDDDGSGERVGDESRAARYREGLDAFADRDDLGDDEQAFVADRRERGPPEIER
jgi:GNAT superfamily N-acetyltransferase